MSGVELLPWDSAFFGRTIARLTGRLTTEDDVARLRTSLATKDVACTYCLVDSSDRDTVERLERLGARLVDVRVTYQLKLSATERLPLASVRDARANDLPDLEPLAARAHGDSRFHFDAHFDRERVRELYREWLRKSIAGTLADGVVTVDDAGHAAGYVTFSGPARTGTPGTGEIGLVAIAENVRGRGYGRALLNGALAELERRGVTTVSVATQGRNIGAQRLYQHAGFRTQALGLWFHLWSPSPLLQGGERAP